MSHAAQALRRGRPPVLPRLRPALVFGALLLLFAALMGRSLYLQGVDHTFLQEQGSARYSREIEVPAYRGRIVDRAGELLAISTLVKSIWAFPGEVEISPGELRALAAVLEYVKHGRIFEQPGPVVAIALCKGHGDCARACPVNGIVLASGAAVQGVEVPQVDVHFQTNVPALMRALSPSKKYSNFFTILLMSGISSCSKDDAAKPDNRLPEDRIVCPCYDCFFCSDGAAADANCPVDNQVPVGNADTGLPGAPCISPNNCSFNEMDLQRGCSDKCVEASDIIAACSRITVERCDSLGCEGAGSFDTSSVRFLGFAESTDSIIEIDPDASRMVVRVKDRSGTSQVTGHIYATGCSTPPC